MRAPLRDVKGCLTAAGFQALERAAPGQAPAELATHLAACPRCQERLLAGGPRAERPERRPPPPAWRAWAGVGLVLVLLLAVLALARWLVAR